MTDAGERPGLRVDAERNRSRILAAAQEVFAAEGLDASMRRIAKHAGVGEPTLRRRFTSKEELVAEAFEDAVAVYADAAATALEDPDAWRGLLTFLERAAGLQRAGRGLAEVLTISFPRTMRHEQERRRAAESIETLLRRAKDSGRLRQDFVAEDVVLLLMAHAGVVTAAGSVAGPLSARLLAYLIQAFAAPGADSLPPPPTPAQVYRALLRLHPTD